MGKYTSYRTSQPTVTSRFPELGPALRYLEGQQDQHFDLVNRLCGNLAGNAPSPLFEVDIVLLSVLNRSLDLVDGFLATYDRWNLSTAAPQVRMQVDNLLRLTLVRVAPPNATTPLLLSGDRLSSHTDPLATPGKKTKLTDARLREHARPVFPWLDLVYERASGWVHFSTVHVGVTIHVGDDNSFSGRFPSDINGYRFEFLEQVLWAMNETTRGILDLVSEFAAGKEQTSKNWPASTAQRPDSQPRPSH